MRKLLLIIFLPLMLQGCLLVPFVESASQAGVTKGDRQALLSQSLKKFQEALFWGDTGKALVFANFEEKKNLKDYIEKIVKNKKVAEAKIISTDLDEAVQNASVTVRWKTYDLSTLVIKESEQTQNWSFYFGDGWKITGMK